MSQWIRQGADPDGGRWEPVQMSPRLRLALIVVAMFYAALWIWGGLWVLNWVGAKFWADMEG